MALPTPVSPKIKSAALWGGLVGVAAAALSAVADGINPHSFDFLGPWGGIIYSAVTLGAASLAGYLTRDPLRDAGAASLATPDTGKRPVAVEESAAPAPLTFGDPSVTDKE